MQEDYNLAEELNDVIDGLKRQMEQLNKRLRSIVRFSDGPN